MKQISLAVMALMTVDASKNMRNPFPHTDLIDLQTDNVHVRNIMQPHTDLIDLQTDSVHIKSMEKEITPHTDLIDLQTDNVKIKSILAQDHRGGFDYQYEPELKAIVEQQEKQANAFKQSSVQGMNDGVNKRLMQVKS